MIQRSNLMPIENRFPTFFDNSKNFIKVYPINPLNNPKKWSKTLKQFVRKDRRIV